MCLWLFVAATVCAFCPTLRVSLIYDSQLVASGEIWRIWSGHLIHFGWAHWWADAWLFLLLGRMLERRHPRVTYATLLLCPIVTAVALAYFDPTMIRYAGLSTINVTFLIFLCLRGWSIDRTDWFWPAVLILHVVEMWMEIQNGGRGGAMVRFDDPLVKVATTAHLAGFMVGVVAWGAWRSVHSSVNRVAM